MLKAESGIKMLLVPYRGVAPAITDVIGGQVDSAFSSVPSVLQMVQNGNVRALAVSSARRISIAPDIPTIAESGFPSFDVISLIGRAHVQPAIIVVDLPVDGVAVDLERAEVVLAVRSYEQTSTVDSSESQPAYPWTSSRIRRLVGDLGTKAKISLRCSTRAVDVSGSRRHELDEQRSRTGVVCGAIHEGQRSIQMDALRERPICHRVRMHVLHRSRNDRDACTCCYQVEVCYHAFDFGHDIWVDTPLCAQRQQIGV